MKSLRLPAARGALFFAVVAGVWVGAGCGGGDNFVACTGAACGDGGSDAQDGGPNFDGPPGCDITKEPKDSLACVDDSVGVFVDASASAAGADGTKAHPFQTISKALDGAKAKNVPRIYVCAGNYPEDVLLDGGHDGLSIYGGFACNTWQYSGARPVVGKTSLAFKVDNLQKPTVIADLLLHAADGKTPGESSIACLVNIVSSATFNRVRFEAGTGKAGQSFDPTPAAMPASSGNNATTTSGAPQCENTCPDGKSIGGNGGDVGFNNASPGQPQLGGGNMGQLGMSCGSGGGGGSGTAGTAGADMGGAQSLGKMQPGAWAPTNGGTGVDGSRGQGGGGGAGRQGGGGSGGCGGCGGKGGGGGGGGGGSIGLLVIGSPVILSFSEIVTTQGGDGGNGAVGQTGQGGGVGGNGAVIGVAGCSGGDGGNGGNGGSGGGGAGGVAIGVFWKGAVPPTADVDTRKHITVGGAGKAGLGTSASNNGIAGLAGDLVECNTANKCQ